MENLNFNKYSDIAQRFISELEEIDSIIDQNHSILIKSNWEIIMKEWEIKGVENKIAFFHKKIKALKEVFIDYDLQKDELIINDKNGVYPYTFELKKFIREIKNKYNSKLYNEVCKINNYKKELSQEIKKENKFTNVWTETNSPENYTFKDFFKLILFFQVQIVQKISQSLHFALLLLFRVC